MTFSNLLDACQTLSGVVLLAKKHVLPGRLDPRKTEAAEYDLSVSDLVPPVHATNINMRTLLSRPLLLHYSGSPAHPPACPNLSVRPRLWAPSDSFLEWRSR